MLEPADIMYEWLKVSSLEEILEENDLGPEDALAVLYRNGLLELPRWLEDWLENYELQPGEETD